MGNEASRLFQDFKFGHLGSHKAGLCLRLSPFDAGLRV